MGKNIEELNFLRGELKKINAQIEKLQYGSGVMETQVKLWELKENIEKKIKECEYVEEN
jgi:hypothetical protein